MYSVVQIKLSFKNEFLNQWSWNRDNSDKPRQEYLDQFTTLKDNSSIALHAKEAIALSWSEVLNLRTSVRKIAKNLFKGLYRNKDCLYYDINRNSFWGCPR